MTVKDKDYYDFLVDRIKECLSLSTSDDKLNTTANLISRYAADLRDNVNANGADEDTIKRYFNNFVNRALSSVEAIGMSETQYKAIRKLMLSEIYGCCEVVVKDRRKEKK